MHHCTLWGACCDAYFFFLLNQTNLKKISNYAKYENMITIKGHFEGFTARR